MGFLANGDDERAKEVYVKLDDVESLLGLYVRKQDWDAALKLAEDPNGTFSEETRAKFDEALYLPYAEWLAVHDKFDEALEAYRKSGREDRAARMMQQLTFNAVVVEIQGRVLLLLVASFRDAKSSSEE